MLFTHEQLPHKTETLLIYPLLSKSMSKKKTRTELQFIKKQQARSDYEYEKSSSRRQWSLWLDALAMRNLHQLFHA